MQRPIPTVGPSVRAIASRTAGSMLRLGGVGWHGSSEAWAADISRAWLA